MTYRITDGIPYVNDVAVSMPMQVIVGDPIVGRNIQRHFRQFTIMTPIGLTIMTAWGSEDRCQDYPDIENWQAESPDAEVTCYFDSMTRQPPPFRRQEELGRTLRGGLGWVSSGQWNRLMTYFNGVTWKRPLLTIPTGVVTRPQQTRVE